MKRAIVVGVRESQLENKQTKEKESVLFITFCRLPSKMKTGGLWFPKSTELISTACFNKDKQAEDYEKYKNLVIGSLCDITYGVNDFNGKTFIANINMVEPSPYTPDQLFL